MVVDEDAVGVRALSSTSGKYHVERSQKETFGRCEVGLHDQLPSPSLASAAMTCRMLGYYFEIFRVWSFESQTC